MRFRIDENRRRRRRRLYYYIIVVVVFVQPLIAVCVGSRLEFLNFPRFSILNWSRLMSRFEFRAVVVRHGSYSLRSDIENVIEETFA